MLTMLRDLLLVLVGGLCAALGGLVATWYQSKKARKIRREEIIGEKQVEVYRVAARTASCLQSLLIQGTLEDALNYVNEQGDWFWENRLFLPQGFQNKWVTIAKDLRKAVRLERVQENREDGAKRDKLIKILDDLESRLDKLAEEAEKEILKELGLSPVEIERVSQKDPPGKD